MSISNGKSAANGTTKNTPVVALQPKSTEQKPELSTLQVTAPEPKPVATPPVKSTLSIDDIFYKMDLLYSLRDKREKLKDSLDKLTRFKLSSDSRTDNIIISDKDGRTFSTFNPEVLAKTIDWLKEDLSKKIEDVETEIRKLL